MSLPCTFSINTNAHVYYNTDSDIKIDYGIPETCMFSSYFCCILNTVTVFVVSMWWHICLRHCATSRFPIVSLEFFFDILIIFPAAVWPRG
jgi:hypothetical protein